MVAPAQDEFTLQPKIELFISCRNLKDMDMTSKSDPKVEVFYATDSAGGRTQFQKIGETEQIKNNLNPDFANSIQVQY